MSSARDWVLIVVLTMVSGVIYGALFGEGRIFVGAVFALGIGTPILAFERQLLFRRLNRWMQRLPTPAFLLTSLAAYFTMMNLGFAVAGLSLHLAGFLQGTMRDAGVARREVLLYSLAVFTVSTFLIRVRLLLGREVFLSMLVSRYRHPRQEERVFLFVDLVGSTAFAERFGDLRAQELLGALFAAMAEPVRRNRGAIDDYIGDAAIITWPIGVGIGDARCVRCIFDILAALEADADRWLAEFGQVPRLRAALHGGPVVTAEIGVDHHKIAFFGDTVNTTARLETLCRALERNVLISTDLVRRIELPEGIVAEDRGAHALRGRGQVLGVTALAVGDAALAGVAEDRPGVTA